MKRKSRGISLLEVLISMGIMVIGLLSVAALFPVGHYHVSKAKRMDSAATVGQAALGEIKTRGLLRLDHDSLVRANSRSFQRRDLLRGRALAIDPLWCSQPGVARLNLPNDTPFSFLPATPYTLPPGAPFMELVTLAQFPGSSAMEPPLAEQLFMSHDDLSLEFPTDRDQPSTTLFRSDGSGKPLQRQFQGDYSWMLTVVPAEADPAGDLYTVSVVVFYKRPLRLANDPNPPDPPGLMMPNPTGVISGPGFVEVEWSSLGVSFLAETKPGQWVMLSGKGTNPNPDIFRWYRVMMVQSDTATGATRLMLAGPQWNPTITPYVSIFEGTVGIYEKTMHIEGPSLY